MFSGQLFFVSNIPDYVSKRTLWSPFGNIMEVMYVRQATIHFKHQDLRERRTVLSFSVISNRQQVKVQVASNTAVATSLLKGNSFEGQTLSDQAFMYGEVGDDYDDDSPIAESESEMLRRKKIGLANKGKIPWNKGITHNEVTRQKIKQRTIEALSNPQVRKKMSECYRDRSEECKGKISVSLRHVWAKRLNYPRQREEFYLSWFESIAVAAKKGGKDQKEFEWDSYNKMAEELARQKQEQEVHEVKAKVKTLFTARKNMKKTNKFSAPARCGSEHVIEGQPEKRVKRKKSTRSSDEDEIVVPEDSNLQTRLSKLKIKKPAPTAIKAETKSSLAWEKLDLEDVKRVKSQKVSLADQIQSAKNRRKILISTSSCID